MPLGMMTVTSAVSCTSSRVRLPSIGVVTEILKVSDVVLLPPALSSELSLQAANMSVARMKMRRTRIPPQRIRIRIQISPCMLEILLSGEFFSVLSLTKFLRMSLIVLFLGKCFLENMCFSGRELGRDCLRHCLGQGIPVFYRARKPIGKAAFPKKRREGWRNLTVPRGCAVCFPVDPAGEKLGGFLCCACWSRCCKQSCPGILQRKRVQDTTC